MDKNQLQVGILLPNLIGLLDNLKDLDSIVRKLYGNIGGVEKGFEAN